GRLGSARRTSRTPVTRMDHKDGSRIPSGPPARVRPTAAGQVFVGYAAADSSRASNDAPLAIAAADLTSATTSLDTTHDRKRQGYVGRSSRRRNYTVHKHAILRANAHAIAAVSAPGSGAAGGRESPGGRGLELGQAAAAGCVRPHQLTGPASARRGRPR